MFQQEIIYLYNGNKITDENKTIEQITEEGKKNANLKIL